MVYEALRLWYDKAIYLHWPMSCHVLEPCTRNFILISILTKCLSFGTDKVGVGGVSSFIMDQPIGVCIKTLGVRWTSCAFLFHRVWNGSLVPSNKYGKGMKGNMEQIVPRNMSYHLSPVSHGKCISASKAYVLIEPRTIEPRTWLEAN